MAVSQDFWTLAPTPSLPGVGGGGPLVTAMVYEVQLESPGIHTKRHFGGVLETHTFFSREAVHAALFDLWAGIAPAEYTPDPIPYASTPLVATQTRLIMLKYASPAGWDKVSSRRQGLTVGTMQAMAPGTLLRGAVWGNAAVLPDLFVGRAFAIGKGRAAARVIRCVRQDVVVDTRQATPILLPVQVPRTELVSQRFRRIAYRKTVETGRYSLVLPALDRNVPRFVLDGVTVPALDFWSEFHRE